MLTVLQPGTHVNREELPERLDLECSQALALTGDGVEVFFSRDLMRESQTRSALRSNRLLTGAIGVQDIGKRNFARLTASYAQNSHGLVIGAALHNHGDKPHPLALLGSPLLAGVFRQDRHRPLF